MADPFAAPVITQQQFDKARRDQVDTTLEGMLFVGTVVRAYQKLSAPGGKLVKTGVGLATGFQFIKEESKGVLVKMGKLTPLTALLPTPVGFVPAEIYGQHPEFYKQQLGRPVGQKPPMFSATDERILLHQVRVKATEIGDRIATTKQVHLHTPPVLVLNGPGKLNITIAEFEWLKSLPPGISQTQLLIPQLEARQGDLLHGPPPNQTVLLTEFSGPSTSPLPQTPTLAVVGEFGLEFIDGHNVLPGSVQLQNFQPVNQKAKDNEDSATGIRKELHSERADP